MSEESNKPGGRTINTGGGAYFEGDVSTGGGDFVGRDKITNYGASPEEVAKLFDAIYAKIDAHPKLAAQDKVDLKEEVKEVKAEVEKGDKADESFLSRRLRNIQRMAPDILEVVLATMGNPAAGLGLVAKKVADRLKASPQGGAAG